MPVPSVYSVSPARLATDVALDVEIRAVYTGALDADSVSAASVLLVDLVLGTTVPIGSVSVNYKTITIRPAAALVGNTRYQVTLKSSIRSDDGYLQAKDFVWQFTTVAAALAAPTLLTPADKSSIVPA